MDKRRDKKVRCIRWLYTIWMMLFPLFILDLLINWKLANYINPRYHWLVTSAGVVLLVLGVAIVVIKSSKPIPGGWLPYPSSRGSIDEGDPGDGTVSMVFWTAMIFLPLVLGLVFFGQGLSVHSASSSGFQGQLVYQGTMNVQVSGRDTSKWTFKDWYARISSDPDPDDYRGMAVNIDGTAYSIPQLPKNYFLLNRYMIWCCTADAVPIDFPVRVEDGMQIPADNTWVRVKGTMEPEVFKGKKIVVIYASSVEKAKMPNDPYIY